MRVRSAVFFLLVFCGPAVLASEQSPREVLNSLNGLRLDAQHVYTISPEDRIELRLGDLAIDFEQGKLAFFQPFEGRITGLVFSGVGHTLALPRDPAEKQQMALFLGTPVLDQEFVSIYARFTDDSAKDLLEQFSRASAKVQADESFCSMWVPQLERLNPTHSLRILFERYTAEQRHFFHAGIDGVLTGPFDVLLDDMRSENFMLGQPRTVNKYAFYDVWTSYALPDFKAPETGFRAVTYQVNTTIRQDNSLDGDATVELRTASGGESILFGELSRTLKVDSITLASGEALQFFQNEGLTEQQVRTRGDDTLCVFLPHAVNAGTTITLRFHYRGNVIQNYGNSVLYVGERGSWYPHFGDTSDFARYDLTFRWPKHLRLVATGEKSGEHEDGDSLVAHWKSNLPVSEAGFNLGEYAVSSIAEGNHSVQVYANKILEEAILARLQRAAQEPDALARPPILEMRRSMDAMEPATPSPANALNALAREVNSAITFFEKYNGPFPFPSLAVSQIPGTFGQGWPGLLYLSTFSFLPRETQQQVGFNATAQLAFTDIMPVHEVAHQWWGNVVGWSSYRDQWIDEGLAVYLSLLFADSQKIPDCSLQTWLARYRKRLTTKPPDEELAPGDVGPVTMGNRLVSSKAPDAFDPVLYYKSAWIFHMLREMMHEPNTRDADERFITLLHTLVTKYAQKALTTDDLQKEVQAVMTRKMDLEGGRSMEWFFAEYVYGTAIPHYRVSFTAHRSEKGFQVRGKLLQSGVPHSFIAPVPLYGSSATGRSTYLGTVVAVGEETSFSFSSQSEPRKIVIDPRMTLLCVPE